MISGPLQRTVEASLKSSLQGQRVILITSLNGSKRRSKAFVEHLLRSRLNCAVSTATIAESSVSGCKDAIDLAKRTHVSAVIGLGGSSILDATKFVAYELAGSQTPIVTIPTVASGGKELLGHAELFNWDTEERVVIVNDKPVIQCLLDPELALGDKINLKTDCCAFASALSLFFNVSDDCLSENAQFLSSLKEAFKVVLNPATPASTQFTPEERLSLFKPASFAINDQLTKETSLDIVVSNAILSRVAVPRSLVRNALLYSSVALRTKNSNNFGEVLKHVTSTSTEKDALNRISVILEKAGTPKTGLNGLLTSFLDHQAVEVLHGHIEEWMTEASNAPQYASLNMDVSRLKHEMFVRGW